MVACAKIRLGGIGAARFSIRPYRQAMRAYRQTIRPYSLMGPVKLR